MNLLRLLLLLLFPIIGFSQSLESISPNSAKNGQTLDVTITGSNTNFTQGSGPTVSFYSNQQQGSSTTLNVSKIQVLSDTQLKVTVSVPSKSLKGDYTVYVKNGNGSSLYLEYAFHVEGLTPPKLESISPNTAKNGQTLDVTITGSNTNFTQGSSTTVSFYGYQQGSSTTLNVSKIQVLSDTQLKVTVSVPSKTLTGDYAVYVKNGNSSSLYLDNAFHVEGLTPPKLESISPNTAKNGQTLDVTITGSNTNFTQGSSTTVSFYGYQQGSSTTLNVSKIQVLSDTQLKVTVSVPSKTLTGDYAVYVKNGNSSSLYLDNAFHVEGLTPPKLESISPNTAKNGQTLDVTITGSNTNFTQGSGTTVSFYGYQQGSSTTLNVSKIQVLSDTQLKVTVFVPSKTLTGDYSVYVNDGSNSYLYLDNAFRVNGLTPPKLKSISPNTAKNGQTLDVTITGSNTNFIQGSGTTVSFYGNQNGDNNTLKATNIKVISDTVLKATVSVPYKTYTDDYSVYVNNGNSSSLYLEYAFHVEGLTPPKLESISPNTAKNGQTLDVTITGSNTNFTQGSGTTVSFYSYQQGSSTTLNVSKIQVLSDTQLKVTVSVPYKTLTGDYSVYVNDGSNSYLYLDNAFHVNGLTPPKIKSITPNTAKNGQTLVVTITGSNTNFTQGSGTTVSFYGNSNTLQVTNIKVISDTLLKATVSIPYKTFTGDYSVYVNDESNSYLYLENAFRVEGLTPPKLKSITPNTAKNGQTLDVTISGINTTFMQGSATAVSFYGNQIGNSKALQVTNLKVISDTLLKATVSVPYKTFTGDYSVYVNDGSNSYLYLENAFRVEGLTPPKLKSITPNTAKNGQTLDVTISGINTTFTQGSATTVSFYSYQQGSSTTLDVYNVKVLSDTLIQVTVSVPYKTFTGDYSVYVDDGYNSNLYLEKSFYVNGLTPKLHSISPNSASVGQTLDVTITGSNTTFTQGSSTVVSIYSKQQGGNTNLTISSINVLSDTIIKATVFIPMNTILGEFDVRVSDSQNFDFVLEKGFKVVQKNVGITSNTYVGMSVYPNPTNDIVILEISDLPLNGMDRYKIIDISGKELYTSVIRSEKTEVSLKSICVKGVYFLHVLDNLDNSVDIKKIVLE